MFLKKTLQKERKYITGSYGNRTSVALVALLRTPRLDAKCYFAPFCRVLFFSLLKQANLSIVRIRQFIVINDLDNIVRLNVSCSNTPLLQERRVEIVCVQILTQMYPYQNSRASRTKTYRISIRIVRTLVVLKN